MRKLHFFWILLISALACEENNGSEDMFAKTPPEVIYTQPAEGEDGVAMNTDVIVAYNKPIMLGNPYQITVNNKATDVDINGSQLFINAVLEKNTNYNVSVSGTSILDWEKNYANGLIFSFSTETNIPVSIDDDLVTSSPSNEARNLYIFLKESYGKKIISSAMANVGWNLNEAEWVKQHTGKYPAMATFDYIHLPFSPAGWVDYSNTDFIEEWWESNGIVSAGWHWNVPTYQGSGEYSFYSAETSFKASNATVGGTWENDVVKTDLEKIAGYLKLLKEKNIPVIWRPLHEAAGNIYEYPGGTAWFWWGQDGAEAFKKLWIYMFDYFQEQELSNLIWVWTTQTKDKDFYPGGDYVDIIGRDIYNNSETNSIVAQFVSAREEYPGKMLTLSELGNVATIQEQWNSGAKWSWFMPWYDYERTNNPNGPDFKETNHRHANAAWWTDAFNQGYVITREQMPSLK